MGNKIMYTHKLGGGQARIWRNKINNRKQRSADNKCKVFFMRQNKDDVDFLDRHKTDIILLTLYKMIRNKRKISSARHKQTTCQESYTRISGLLLKDTCKWRND